MKLLGQTLIVIVALLFGLGVDWILWRIYLHFAPMFHGPYIGFWWFVLLLMALSAVIKLLK